MTTNYERIKNMTVDEMAKKIAKEFNIGQIKAFMKEYNLTYLGSCLYLWLFNNVSICPKQLTQNAGRAMYVEFAKEISQLLESEER